MGSSLKKKKVLTPEKITKLEKELDEYTKGIVSRALNSFYREFPRIASAVYNILNNTENGKFAEKWLKEELDSFELLGILESWEEMDKGLEFLKEKLRVDFDIDTEKMFPVKYQEIWNLGKKLRETLENDGLLDKVLQIQKIGKERDFNWMSTLRFINSIFLFDGKIWNDERTVCKFPWPIVVDSYIRDFEIFLNHIIRPILYQSSRSNNSYNDDLKLFFDSNKKLLAQIQSNFLKPWLRSKLAHHQYYVDPQRNIIFFFDHDESNPDEVKELTFNAFLRMTIDLNLFLWSIFVIIFTNKKDEKDSLESSILLESHLTKFASNYSLTEGLKRVDYLEPKSFSEQEMSNLIFSKLMKDKSPYVLKESIIFYQIHFERKNPDHRFLYWVFSKIAYLVSHSEMMDRFVRPLALALKPKYNFRTSEPNLLSVVLKYRDGEFNDLFKWINVDVRKALAHYSYEKDEDGKSYYYDKNKCKVYFTISPLDHLQLIFDRLEYAFDPGYRTDMFDFGITKIVILLFYRKEDLKDLNYYFNAIEKISDLKEYNLIVILCYFVCYMMLIEENKINLAIEQINSINLLVKQVDTETIESIWGWIIRRYKIFMPTKYKEGIELLLNEFTLFPKKHFTLVFKIIHYFRIGKRKKVRKLIDLL